MRILALVPARGGSKRLPGKNIRQLGSKPLIHWTIDVIKEIHEVCDVLVSTDDACIADIARQCGAMVPWLRPAVLSTDTASSVDMALHALDWYQANHGNVDGLLLLQPTSPFRTKETICRGIQLFMEHGMQSVVGVSSAASHPMWCMKIDEGKLVPFMDDHGLELRSQMLPPVYCVNGCFYLIKPSLLVEARSFLPVGSVPLVVDSEKESLDIDTYWDWFLAEQILEELN